ncbi:DUF6297 family protein [Arthrobacter rhombi]|uniref:DUF6297 family protein n=1 Tax=Arthrobacter rhombi TaxID=71253 RepID=UPI003FD08604
MSSHPAGPAPSLPTWVPDGPPSGFDPVGATHRLRREHRWAERYDRWGDIYITVFGVVILLAFALGLVQFLAQGLREAAAESLVREGLAVVPGADAGSVLLLLALVAVASILSRMGPVAVDRAQGLWWFSLPVDRVPLLARQLRNRLGWIFIAGAVLWLPLGLSAGTASRNGYSGPPLDELAAGSLTLGAEFVVVGLLVAAGQVLHMRRVIGRGLRMLGVLIVLAYAVDAITRAAGTARFLTPGIWAGLPSAWPSTGSWAIPAILLLVAILGWMVVRPLLGRIPTSELLEAGGISGQAGNSLALLDARSLVGSFARGPRRRSHVRDLWPRVMPVRFTGSPVRALLRAEALVLLRSGAVAGRLLISLALLAGAVTAHGGGTAVVLGVAILVAAALAGQAAGAAAAEAARVPGLDSLLPLDAATTRRAHGLLPAIVLSVWGALAGTILGWALAGPGAPGQWILLAGIGALGGIGVAGGALRLAYRPELEWDAVLQRQMFGRGAGPLMGHAVHGLELMLIAVLPLLLAVLGAAAPAVLLVLAAGFGVGGWFAGTYRRRSA